MTEDMLLTDSRLKTEHHLFKSYKRFEIETRESIDRLKQKTKKCLHYMHVCIQERSRRLQMICHRLLHCRFHECLPVQKSRKL